MHILDALWGALLFLSIIFIALRVERAKPAQEQTYAAAKFNVVYTLAFAAIQAAVLPAVAIVTSLAVNAAGGGLFALPTTGWSVLPAFVAYALTLDFLEYSFHRAQHRFPLLWAMHSFHHSDTTLNASTVQRHYWAEPALKAVSIYLVAGIIIKPGLFILGIYHLLSFYNIFTHMNIRIGFGRWSWVLNSPQYHRLHHSALPEHHDRNFAALFPIFDVLFGAYHQPMSDEYPPTGIGEGERPSGLVDFIFWPIRKSLRRTRFGSRCFGNHS